MYWFSSLCVVRFSIKVVGVLAAKDGFKFGIVELLLLTLLLKEDKYGYQISHEILDMSNGYIYLREGSMYPVLYKLMEKGYITSNVEKIGLRRTRVYYHIEESGKEYLRKIRGDYINNTKAICKVVGISNEELSALRK